jgi:hypothetical protein
MAGGYQQGSATSIVVFHGWHGVLTCITSKDQTVPQLSVVGSCVHVQVGADVRQWFAVMPRATRMLPQKRPASSLAAAQPAAAVAPAGVSGLAAGAAGWRSGAAPNRGGGRGGGRTLGGAGRGRGAMRAKGNGGSHNNGSGGALFGAGHAPGHRPPVSSAGQASAVMAGAPFSTTGAVAGVRPGGAGPDASGALLPSLLMPLHTSIALHPHGGPGTLVPSSTIDQFYLSRHCAVCDQLTRTQKPLCDRCTQQPQASLAILQVRLSRITTGALRVISKQHVPSPPMRSITCPELHTLITAQCSPPLFQATPLHRPCTAGSCLSPGAPAPPHGAHLPALRGWRRQLRPHPPTSAPCPRSRTRRASGTRSSPTLSHSGMGHRRGRVPSGGLPW